MVAVSHGTFAFAAHASANWWRRRSTRHPRSPLLLTLSDTGGSNSARRTALLLTGSDVAIGTAAALFMSRLLSNLPLGVGFAGPDGLSPSSWNAAGRGSTSASSLHKRPWERSPLADC
jgi:hypothetical protein